MHTDKASGANLSPNAQFLKLGVTRMPSLSGTANRRFQPTLGNPRAAYAWRWE